MKVTRLAGAALVILSILFAEAQFITTSTTQVGPGVVHKKFSAPTVPWLLDVLIIDLENPYLTLETVKAANKLKGYETTSSMAGRASYTGHRVVCGTNADFYGDYGVPIGTQVLNGELLKTSSGWSSIGFNVYNQPAIETVTFFGSVTSPMGMNVINAINTTRETDYLVLFNSYFGNNTETNAWGTELVVAPVEGWLVNDTIRCIVEQKEQGIGNMALTSGKAVLSGHGTAAAYLNNISVGDTVLLFLGLTPSIPKLNQLVGGNYKFLHNGSYTGSTNADRHPRTFAGISADSSTLYLATVDGRQMGSIGMTYRELSDFMISLGAYYAVNLDGGGSTTMVVGSEVVNALFTAERAVSNSLMVISSAPQGIMASIQIRPDNFRIFRGSGIELNTTGWDEYFNPIELDAGDITYGLDPVYGIVDTTGKFTVVDSSFSGYLTAEYQGFVDTAYFYIKTLKSITLEPEFQMTDNQQGVIFQITAIDEDNLIQYIPRTTYTWEVLNPAVGYFDSTGTFHGLAEGTSKIVASYLGVSDTVEVGVQIGSGSTVLDSMEVAEHWTMSGVLYDQDNTALTIVNDPRTLGEYSLALSYQFVRSDEGRSWIYLSREIPVYGIPDSIIFDFKSNPERQKTHMVAIEIEDNDGELFQESCTTPDSLFTSYGLALHDFGAVTENGILHYPIKIKTIQLRLGYYSDVGDTNTAVVYFDNLRIKYPAPLGVAEPEEVQQPGQVELLPNWPNPFNSTTMIAYRLPAQTRVSLVIYDLLGREVATLVNTTQGSGIKIIPWNGTDASGHLVASGIYLYRLSTPEQTSTKKMLLIK